MTVDRDAKTLPPQGPDAGIRCACGHATANHLRDGEHLCTLCASRAFRAHYERETRDTIPAPPPTTRDCGLETTADPEHSAA